MSKPLAGLKILFIVPAKDFKDDEYFQTKAFMEEAGAATAICSNEDGEVTGSGGKTVHAVSLTEPRTSEFAGVVVVGGLGSQKHLWENGLAHKALRMMERDRRPMMGLSQSSVVLAKAGLLKGRKATVPIGPDTLKAFKDCEVKFEKKPLVIDGDYVTTDGSEPPERAAKVLSGLVEDRRKLIKR